MNFVRHTWGNADSGQTLMPFPDSSQAIWFWRLYILYVSMPNILGSISSNIHIRHPWTNVHWPLAWNYGSRRFSYIFNQLNSYTAFLRFQLFHSILRSVSPPQTMLLMENLSWRRTVIALITMCYREVMCTKYSCGHDVPKADTKVWYLLRYIDYTRKNWLWRYRWIVAWRSAATAPPMVYAVPQTRVRRLARNGTQISRSFCRSSLNI